MKEMTSLLSIIDGGRRQTLLSSSSRCNSRGRAAERYVRNATERAPVAQTKKYRSQLKKYRSQSKKYRRFGRIFVYNSRRSV